MDVSHYPCQLHDEAHPNGLCVINILDRMISCDGRDLAANITLVELDLLGFVVVLPNNGQRRDESEPLYV